jgi:hypothetical protein
VGVADVPVSIRRCGKPKANGEPCRAQVYPGQDIGVEVPCFCTQHTTPADDALRKKLYAAYTQGREDGEAAAWEDGLERELRKRLDAELAKRPCKHYRMRDVDGQLVELNHRYTYRWVGDGELAVDDVVLIPPSEWDRGWREATVTRLGSDYQGHIVSISRRPE